jgi:hypothetical protein
MRVEDLLYFGVMHRAIRPSVRPKIDVDSVSTFRSKDAYSADTPAPANSIVAGHLVTLSFGASRYMKKLSIL